MLILLQILNILFQLQNFPLYPFNYCNFSVFQNQKKSSLEVQIMGGGPIIDCDYLKAEHLKNLNRNSLKVPKNTPWN